MLFTDAEFEEALQHFGRKGMKWGEHVYGEDKTSGKSVRTPAEEAHRIKVHSAKIGVAAGLGVTVATAGIGLPGAAAIGVGAYFIAKHNTQPSSSFTAKHKAAGVAEVNRLLREKRKK